MNPIYKYSESTVEPAEVEFCPNSVFLRTNIHKVNRDDQTFWVYEEAIMSYDEFSEYSKILISRYSIDSKNDSLTIMEAIADLYDAISNIQGGSIS